MIPLGLGGAATVRIGTYMGRGDWKQAQRITRIAFLCVLVPAIIHAILLILAKDFIGRAVTEDHVVLEIVSKLIPFVALNQVLDFWSQAI